MGTRFSYSGGAPTLALQTTIGSTDLAFTASTSAAAYPDGGAGPFVVIINGSEKIKCASRSGNVFTVAVSGRGYDGTTAATHQAGQPIDHGFDATSATDFAGHVYDTTRDDHTQYLNKVRAIPACKVFDSMVGQAIPNTTNTNVTFDSESWDVEGNHSTVSNTHKLTVITAGKYLLIAQIPWDTSPANGSRTVSIKLNSGGSVSYLARTRLMAGASPLVQVTTTIAQLAAADFVYVEVTSSATTDTAITPESFSASRAEFSMTWQSA